MVRHSREEWKTYNNVFDNFTEQHLLKLQGQGHFDELTQAVALGKEANIFLASKGEDTVVVKIYRTMNGNFNKMYEYLVHDDRYQDIKSNKRKVIFAWVQREYSNLFIAREHIPVPTPHTFKDNILIMDLVGTNGVPAPMLKDVPPKKPQQFYDECRKHLKALYEAGLVHGDISGFNILNHDEKPVFIDFSQATTTKSPRAHELYERDIQNLNAYFSKLKVKVQ